MSPKVSVLMPNYNCERYITEAIESILNQSFTDFEFIIIDDASTDNSWEIIQKYVKKDPRIIALKNDENQRICKTLNRGLEKARGEYIARMDSDDIAKNNWLQQVYDKISTDINIGVCGGNFDIIDENGKKVGEKKFPETDDECRNAIWFRNPFAHNTVIFRKKCYEELGGYDDNLVYAEDLDLWVRYGQKYRFYNIQESLVQYRVFGGNSILKNQKLMIQNTLRIRKKAMKIGHSIGIKGVIFYIGAWCMQFLPPKFVLCLFNKINK